MYLRRRDLFSGSGGLCVCARGDLQSQGESITFTQILRLSTHFKDFTGVFPSNLFPSATLYSKYCTSYSTTYI